MSHIQAIYRRGVFQPLERVDLPEDQRVQLSVGVLPPLDLQAWIREAGELRAAILQRRGILADSTPEIAADRQR